MFVLAVIFLGGPGLAGTRMHQTVSVVDFIGDDGGGCDNLSYKVCRARIRSSPSTNQHPAFYMPDALPVAQPTVSQHCRETELQSCSSIILDTR